MRLTVLNFKAVLKSLLLLKYRILANNINTIFVRNTSMRQHGASHLSYVEPNWRYLPLYSTTYWDIRKF